MGPLGSSTHAKHEYTGHGPGFAYTLNCSRMQPVKHGEAWRNLAIYPGEHF